MLMNSTALDSTMEPLLSNETFNSRKETTSTFLLKKKEEAWDTFQSLPMPTRLNEAWRFANIGKLDIDGYQLPQEKPDAEAILEQSKHLSDFSGRTIFADGHLIAHSPLEPALQKAGAFWLPLDQAIKEHAPIIERYLFESSTQLGSAKFEALSRAFAHAGNVLYVPKGVRIEAPLVAYHWAVSPHAAIFPQTLIIAEDSSQASIVDFYLSAADTPALSSGGSHIHLGANAHVFRKSIQNFNLETLSFQSDTQTTGRDAQLHVLAVNLGSKRARFENQVHIRGEGSHSKLYSLTVANGTQAFDQRTLQLHETAHASSDLLYKNALMDTAKTIFSGMIDVKPGAQQTDAYQTNRNLLLDKTAEAVSLPGLEIEANDVKCSHGATTGQLDKSQLYHMLSRGISLPVAQELLVFGFFEEIIAKVDDEALAENLRLMLKGKFKKTS